MGGSGQHILSNQYGALLFYLFSTGGSRLSIALRPRARGHPEARFACGFATALSRGWPMLKNTMATASRPKSFDRRSGCISASLEDLLAERGIIVSYETVRRWVNRFGPKIASELRKRRQCGPALVDRPPAAGLSRLHELKHDGPAFSP